MDTPKQNETMGPEKPREILVRLTPSEVEKVKDETGATAEATAVACFVRKNLRKNRDAASRRELFLAAGEALGRLERDYGFSPVGLGLMQRLVYSACRRGRYRLARLLAPLA